MIQRTGTVLAALRHCSLSARLPGLVCGGLRAVSHETFLCLATGFFFCIFARLLSVSILFKLTLPPLTMNEHTGITSRKPQKCLVWKRP